MSKNKLTNKQKNNRKKGSSYKFSFDNTPIVIGQFVIIQNFRNRLKHLRWSMLNYHLAGICNPFCRVNVQLSCFLSMRWLSQFITVCKCSHLLELSCIFTVFHSYNENKNVTLWFCPPIIKHLRKHLPREVIPFFFSLHQGLYYSINWHVVSLFSCCCHSSRAKKQWQLNTSTEYFHLLLDSCNLQNNLGFIIYFKSAICQEMVLHLCEKIRYWNANEATQMLIVHPR